MKTVIILAIVAALSMLFPMERASGDDRGAIDRKWQQVRAWQEGQDKRFKAIERDRERPLRTLDDAKRLWRITH